MQWGVGLILLLAVLFTGCTKDRAPKPVITEATILECSTCMDTFSFKKDIIPVFAGNCAVPGCHDFDDEAGGLELDSAGGFTSSLTSNGGVAVSGNPSKSFLYTYLTPGGAEEMPQNNFPLDSCDINKIYCWIQQGALNN